MGSRIVCPLWDERVGLLCRGGLVFFQLDFVAVLADKDLVAFPQVSLGLFYFLSALPAQLS